MARGRNIYDTLKERVRAGENACPPISGNHPSVAISGIGYDEDRNRLTVTFRPSGASYAYYNVSRNAYKNLCNADSKGRHFNMFIRNGYAYTRL
jgi:KTSC domain